MFNGKNPEQLDWYALEIETGKQLRTPTELTRKTDKNNSKTLYQDWWYIVTNKKNKKDYEKLHKTLTRTEITKLLKKIFE